MTQTLIPGLTSNISVSTGTTFYVQIGNAARTTATEANQRYAWRDLGVFSNLYANILTNGTTVASTVKYRVGAANGNQVLNIGIAGTGEFIDSTHTDSPAAGDLICFQMINGGGGTITTAGFCILFAPTSTGNAINKLAATGNITDGSVGTTYYFAPTSSLSTVAAANTEANAQFTNQTAATLQNLAVFLASNSASVATVTSRKNTAAGNLTVSITLGAAGVFEDTTHTDSLAASDLFNYALNSTVTSSFTVETIASTYLTTSGNIHLISGATAPTTVLKSITTYFGLQGNLLAQATAANIEIQAQVAFTSSFMECSVQLNSVSATSNIKWVKGSTPTVGNGNIVITASTTGYFQDGTHTDTVGATDEIAYQLVTGGTGTSLALTYIGCLASYGGSVTYNDTITETVTESDSYTIIATDLVIRSETVTGTDSYLPSAISTALLFSESQTETDIYSSQILLTNFLTENLTASDSAIIIAAQNTTKLETNTATDAIAGAATGLINLNETGNVTDQHLGIASGLGIITETDTEADSYNSSQTQPGTNSITEILSSNDSLNIFASDIASIAETIAANDNYDSSLIPNPSIITEIPLTGAGSEKPYYYESRRKYLEWLKKKETKNRIRKAIFIAPEKAKELLAIEIKHPPQDIKKKIDLTLRELEIEGYAQKIAFNYLSAIYQEIEEKQQEEDELFMMMML